MEDRLTEIRARADAATPGPWTVTDDGALSSGVPPSSPVANGEFIAHARDDVPWLLGEIERLKAEVAMLVARYGEADGARLVEKDRADKAEAKVRELSLQTLADAHQNEDWSNEKAMLMERLAAAEKCALRLHTELLAYVLTVTLVYGEPPTDRIQKALADPAITEINEWQG